MLVSFKLEAKHNVINVEKISFLRYIEYIEPVDKISNVLRCVHLSWNTSALSGYCKINEAGMRFWRLVGCMASNHLPLLRDVLVW